MVPLTAVAKNKNTPMTSWMNFFPAFPSAGASLGGFAYCTYAFCPISLLDAGVQLVFRYHEGGDAGSAEAPS